MPAHHKLEQFLDEYLDAAGIGEQDKTPLFRSASGRTGILTDRPMHRVDAYQMVRRRTAEAGLRGKFGCHVFRATGITAYLEAGGTLENAQAMAAHESPRTTKPYDRTGDEITLDEVERNRGQQRRRYGRGDASHGRPKRGVYRGPRLARQGGAGRTGGGALPAHRSFGKDASGPTTRIRPSTGVVKLNPTAA
jgi:hypothetical protein